MPPSLGQLPTKVDYVDSVYAAVRDAITDGSLAPGERITQEEIAAQLQVSRSPVIQALRLLKEDGLLQDAPGRGLQVKPLEGEHIAQLYQVRGALDALAVRLAAERKAVIDPALIKAGRAASKAGVMSDIVDADLAFHQAIYRASGNPLIAESTHRHWTHLRRVMGAVYRASGPRTKLWDEHQAIADAIAKGDVQRAVALSDEHMERARANVLTHLRGALSLSQNAA